MNNKLKRVLSSVLALTMAMVAVPLSAFNLKADAAGTMPLSQKEYLTQAIQLLGAPYSSTAPGNPYSKSYTVNSAASVKSNGCDCTGFIWWTLASLGVSFSWNGQDHYPVPYDYNRWMALYYNGGTMTYKGSSAPITIGHKDNQVATNWWDGVSPGSVIISQYGYYDNGNPMNHGVYYIGEFANQAAIKTYLTNTLGLSIADSAFQNRGTGTHWVIESNGSYGVKISNPPTISKSDIYSCNLTYFKITEVKSDLYKYIVKKTDASGNAVSGIKFGVYTNSSCTNKVAEITTNANGIAWLDNSGKGYADPQGPLYAKEITSKTGYGTNATVVTMTELKNTETVPSTVATVKNTDLGNLSIKKVTEDGKNLSGWGFTVKGMVGNTVVSTNTCTTNASGVATLSNLPRYSISGANGTASLITYVITETSAPSNVSWYFDASKSISTTLTALSGGAVQTKTVNYNNNLKRGTVTVSKTCEDGLNSGITFRLTGTANSGATVDMTAVTNDKGIATFSNVLIGKNYTLTEVNTAIKYVIPNPNNVDVNWNDVTNSSVTNILKKFTLTLVKNDSETATIPQGDATLQGAEFSLYKGGQLQKVYTTDKNGQIVTDEYICASDYTIKETKAPEGYLINDTVYSLTDAAPSNFTVEHNSIGLTVKENVVKGTIAIIKYYGANENNKSVEEGAEFELYLKSSGSYENAKETERDYLVTDDKGAAVSKDLPYGTYVLHQVKGKEGYKFLSDQEFVISEDGKLVTSPIALINTGIEAYIKVVKVDAETKKTIPLTGAIFEIYDSNKNLMTFKEYNSTKHAYVNVSTFETNEEGFILLPEKLQYGTYYLKEIKAPYGYVLDEKLQKFKVTDDTHSEVIYEVSYDDVIDVEKQDMAQKGIIKVFKQGEVFSTVTETEGIYSPKYETKGLEGAVYEIKALEDIKTPDGTVRYVAGTVVDTITTGNDGWASSKEVYLGKYSVTETKAPFGMIINATPIVAELTYAGQTVKITEKSVSFTNDRQKVAIDISKKLEVDEAYDIGDNEEIVNVKFGLYAKEDIVATDGTKIPADGLVEIIQCDENGKATATVDLPIGEYYFKEIETDEHYKIDETEYIVKFEYAGQEVETVTISANEGIPVDNFLKYGNVVGTKVDEDGEPLEGVEFAIYNANDMENPIQTVKTDAEGKFEFENVPYGNWIVKEVSTLEGYVLPDEEFDIAITDDAQSIPIEATNYFIRGSVQITKVDEEYPDNKLTGAEFEVYVDSDSDGKFNPEVDTYFGDLEEIEEGIYQLDDLRYGGYFIHERVAPIGFVQDDGYYYFRIDEDGELVNVVNSDLANCFINKPIKGELVITKTDIADGRLIPNAGFRIKDENGNIVAEGYTDENGVAKFSLRYGKYTYQEFDAPDGYLIDESEYSFEITEDGQIIKAEMTNEREPEEEIVQTGDTACFGAVAVVTAVSFVGFLVTRRKVKKYDSVEDT